MISRISSMPVRDAASISCTSTLRDSEIETQGSHTPQGWMVGGVRLPSGPMQFSARAMMRAVGGLAHPRTPKWLRRSDGLAAVLPVPDLTGSARWKPADPRRIRYGCFVPDLTGLASGASSELPAGDM